MGSPFGPLMANAFMRNIKEQLANQNKMPAFCNRYVDYTLRKMRSVSSASEVLSTLNEIHSSLSFKWDWKTMANFVIIKKCSPTRHKDLRETNQYWSFTTLPKPCWCEVQAFSGNTMLDRSFKLSSNCQFSIKNVNVLKGFSLPCIILKFS